MQHDAEILDQFTRQAEPFLQRHAHSNQDLLELMAECSGLGPDHFLLDVACGPGIVSCFFARRVAHVTGLDIVPAMLERAQRFQQENQLHNIEWTLGASNALPFADDTFDVVVTRFSFHHYIDPATALIEMKRVCKPGGRVLVADVTPSREAQENFNHWEILRDPSHTRALTQAELEGLGAQAQLQLLHRANFGLVMNLEDLLESSFPRPGDAEKIRSLFQQDIRAHADQLGVAARSEEGRVKLTYPVAVFAWQK